jgi:hypothetical protein
MSRLLRWLFNGRSRDRAKREVIRRRRQLRSGIIRKTS